jgi:hypothetical protein
MIYTNSPRTEQLRRFCHEKLDALLDAEISRAQIPGTWDHAAPTIIEGSSHESRCFLRAYGDYASFLRANSR